MLAVPQLGFWLSLCVAVGASVIVPDRVTAHTDFSAGKTPEQLFSSDCSDCHRSAYGITHSRSAPALTAFSELKNVIQELEQLHNFLDAEGQRLEQEISEYVQLKKSTVSSTRLIADNLLHWKKS